MYWEDLGFNEQPFALTPNPDFLFLSANHQEAFAHLLYGIDNRVGFIVLSGEVGTGKTTLIRTLLNQLDPDNHRTALIFNPTLSPSGLLQEIIREFGLTDFSREPSELIERLNQFLLAENEADRTVLLVIDEAQNLSPEVLEQIRLISNLETERAKLIQIILVGQPELKSLLAREDLRQLNQRITVNYHLEPMGFNDTDAYIMHRIRIAANGSEPLKFSTAAVRRIYSFSRGLPRLINAACDRALLIAYTRNLHIVSRAMAAEAVSDIRKDLHPQPIRRSFAVALAITLILLIAVGIAAMSRQKPLPPKAIEAATPLLDSRAALAELASTTTEENLLISINAILRTWQVPAIARTADMPGDLRTVARQRGFFTTDLTADLATLARFNMPALLQIRLPTGELRLLALTGIGPHSVTLVPAVSGRTTLTEGELATIWNGQATLLWKNYHSIPNRILPGRSKGVKSLQELLTGAGYYGGSANGRYDAATSRALKSFQQAEGLMADGIPGDKTLLLLYRRAGGFFPPGITQQTEKSGPAADRNSPIEPVGKKPLLESKG